MNTAKAKVIYVETVQTERYNLTVKVERLGSTLANRPDLTRPGGLYEARRWPYIVQLEAHDRKWHVHADGPALDSRHHQIIEAATNAEAVRKGQAMLEEAEITIHERTEQEAA